MQRHNVHLEYLQKSKKQVYIIDGSLNYEHIFECLSIISKSASFNQYFQVADIVSVRSICICNVGRQQGIRQAELEKEKICKWMIPRENYNDHQNLAEEAHCTENFELGNLILERYQSSFLILRILIFLTDHHIFCCKICVDYGHIQRPESIFFHFFIF